MLRTQTQPQGANQLLQHYTQHTAAIELNSFQPKHDFFFTFPLSASVGYFIIIII